MTKLYTFLILLIINVVFLDGNKYHYIITIQWDGTY